MKSKWIEHEEKRILFVDAANLEHDFHTLKKELEAIVRLLESEPKSSVLVVADLRNTFLDNNALLVLMSNAPLAAPHFRKSAMVIESNSLRRVVLDSLGQFIGHLPKRFSEMEPAMEWLVSEKEQK
jgi:hypothetical protein